MQVLSCKFGDIVLKIRKKRRQQRPVIAVDLADTKAHLLLAAKASPFAHLLAIDNVTYDNDMFEQGVATQSEKLARILQPVLTAYPIDSVALHIADEFIISDHISTPDDLGAENLEAYITLELESRLSVPLAEVYFDYTIAKTKSNDYIFAACNKKIVDSRIEMIKILGLSVSFVGIEKFLLANLRTHCQQHNLAMDELFKKWQIHPEVNQTLLDQHGQTFSIAAALALETLWRSYT